MMQLRVLVLDDEQRLRDEMADYLEGQGYLVYCAAAPSEAFEILKLHEVDIAILDINLPEKDGLTVLKEIKEVDPDLEVLIVTGQGDMEKAITALRLGAVDFFTKPLRLAELVKSIERTKRFINLSRMYSQVRQNYDHLQNLLYEALGLQMIGHSPAMQAVKDSIQTAASHSDLSVLITGESGTGKELVARSIHQLSSRKDGFFHAVNCAAIPENLFESEFFGYVKGAFTGAVANKPGWFEIADKGTLFLDEIGDMLPNMQAKLLRVSEDGMVRRVGSNRDIFVNVRIITATNKDIRKRVSEDSFRQDLYHRINGFQIHVPPLRERVEDIPELIDCFISSFSTRTGKKITGIETALMERLLSYHYPGNIRELKNMVERALILCNGEKLANKHFCFDPLKLDSETDCPHCQDEIMDLNLLEKTTIQKALKATANNRLKAAKLLNITWQALERRIIKHDLKIM
ncbi:MAG: sigma-54 dependent transcriptional regulator [Candidatus Cloacimonadaceae bacterium]|nr:sigma-54 dependent transcriptional regulator [Candidatus Cloacimonadaceae bacterium]